MTSFIDRYLNGETVTVYTDITALGQEAFSERYFPDVSAVVSETMERTAYNLTVIYNALQECKYNFRRDINYNFESPLSSPLKDTERVLVELEKAIAPFGTIPLSLKLFYQIVGSCNFAWDYETDEDILWEEADPIQIVPLDDLIEQASNQYWYEEMKENKEYYGLSFLELSADYLHKDNISGGEAYSIEITRERSVDSRFLFEERNTSFIDYLREVFENCGFGRTSHLISRPDFVAFCNRVKPELKLI